MEGHLPYLLLLQLLLLAPAPSPSYAVRHVFARECETGRLLSLHYWHKFHAIITNLNEAPEFEKDTVRSMPKIRESVVPHKLIREIADHLDDDGWLKQLADEYLEDGGADVSTLVETSQHLYQVVEEYGAAVPLCALRELWWRGLTLEEYEQPRQQERLVTGLRFFFGVPAVARAQEDQPKLLGHYLMDMLNFETSAALDVFEHTLGELELDVELPDDIAEEFQSQYDYESDDNLEDDSVCGEAR